MSYGQSRLTIERRTAGHVGLRTVSAADALGPRLVFGFDCTFTDLPQSNVEGSDPVVGYRLTDLRGEVRLGEHGLVVGSLQWLGSPFQLRSLGYAEAQSVQLVCDLDPYRLDRLEAHRDGGPLTLWIQLWPTIVHDGRLLNDDLRCFRAEIPRDTWIGVLTRLRPDSYELIELRVDLSHASLFRTSVGEVRKARRLVDGGDYDGAVIACRKAIEQLTRSSPNLADQDASDLKAALATVVGDERAGAYDTLTRNLKAVGNIAAHQPGPGLFSRQEALFVARSTENLLSLVGAILGGSVDVPTNGAEVLDDGTP